VSSLAVLPIIKGTSVSIQLRVMSTSVITSYFMRMFSLVLIFYLLILGFITSLYFNWLSSVPTFPTPPWVSIHHAWLYLYCLPSSFPQFSRCLCLITQLCLPQANYCLTALPLWPHSYPQVLLPSSPPISIQGASHNASLEPISCPFFTTPPPTPHSSSLNDTTSSSSSIAIAPCHPM